MIQSSTLAAAKMIPHNWIEQRLTSFQSYTEIKTN